MSINEMLGMSKNDETNYHWIYESEHTVLNVRFIVSIIQVEILAYFAAVNVDECDVEVK